MRPPSTLAREACSLRRRRPDTEARWNATLHAFNSGYMNEQESQVWICVAQRSLRRDVAASGGSKTCRASRGSSRCSPISCGSGPYPWHRRQRSSSVRLVNDARGWRQTAQLRWISWHREEPPPVSRPVRRQTVRPGAWTVDPPARMSSEGSAGLSPLSILPAETPLWRQMPLNWLRNKPSGRHPRTLVPPAVGIGIFRTIRPTVQIWWVFRLSPLHVLTNA
jgi:hypothetical protein